METIDLSLSSQVDVGNFFMKSPVVNPKMFFSIIFTFLHVLKDLANFIFKKKGLFLGYIQKCDSIMSLVVGHLPPSPPPLNGYPKGSRKKPGYFLIGSTLLKGLAIKKKKTF